MSEELMEVEELEVVNEEPFFAPANTDLVDGLIGQYQHARKGIAELAAYMREHLAGGASVLDYFMEGNATEDRGRYSLRLSAAQLFDEEGAVRALNSAYWSKALNLTDLLNLMPQKRRNEWHEVIRDMKAPEFTEETVRATLTDLLAKRPLFLAERVDGIFRGLSGEHVTNAPEGFGKRMITAYVLNEWGSTNHGRVGLINDLRCVIAKFMGREEPGYNASDAVVVTAKRQYGEWLVVDGGALKIRVYKKGTAHVEVHPDMAWRLNQILAHLYPLAIPAKFRQRPPRRTKTVERILRPLPTAVIEQLARTEPARERVEPCAATRWQPWHKNIPRTLQFDYREHDKHARAEAEKVLEAIGGVPVTRGHMRHWVFDYEPAPVRDQIVASGCVPDQKSHQFYPTPRYLAARAVELAGIEADDLVLEPSAGIGGLADLLPKSRTTCVEVSALHCQVLQQKGLSVEQADFLTWKGGKFDRIVMNPPFDRGQWAAHVEHAAGMLKTGGRLVAVLPSGARERDFLPGLAKSWEGPFDNAFADASVSVVILIAGDAAQVAPKPAPVKSASKPRKPPRAAQVAQEEPEALEAIEPAGEGQNSLF